VSHAQQANNFFHVPNVASRPPLRCGEAFVRLGAVSMRGKSIREAPRQAVRGEVIRSRDNQWLKRFREALAVSADGSNARDGVRDSARTLGLEGPRLVGEGLRSAVLDAILVSESGERHLTALRSALGGYQAARGAPPRILRTTDALFDSIAGTETPQHIAALARPCKFSLGDMLAPKNALIAVLIAVQDPGNVGTAIRSAEAFGASGMIAAGGTASPWSQKALRASAGSVLRLPLLRESAPAALLAQLRAARLRLCASCVRPMEGREPVSLAEVDLRGPTALLIGNEAAGLPVEVLRSADVLVRVPLTAPVESLNAGVATSLLLYEAARQRGGIAANEIRPGDTKL